MAATKLEELEINAFLAQGELLARLQSDPSWAGWTTLLTSMRQSALEELARCADAGEFRFWQGVASALGEVLDRPKRIVESAAAHQRSEEEERRGLRPELRAAIGMGLDLEGDI
jgi:hypothetical protein